MRSETISSAGRTVEIRDLEMVYAAQGRDFIRSLDTVSLEARELEFLSIVGPSGCGKTTLLKIISGLLFPTRGTVLLRNRPVKGPNPNVGVVFQRPVLMNWRTVMQNVLLPIEIRGLNMREYGGKAAELINLAGLGGFENRYPYELSGGMQQRACICRALIQDPSLLLMDEPFGALDAFTREMMNLELLRIWTERKMTVIFITHSISEAVFLSDRVAVMTPRPGRINSVITIPIPRPRTIDMMAKPEFGDLVLRIRNVFGAGNAAVRE
jgi:NitT/TauT family transport system ATP-binding protein